MSEEEIKNTEVPILELRFPDGTAQPFRSVDELESWIAKERDYWAFLLGPDASLDSLCNEAYQVETYLDSDIRQHILSIRNQPEQATNYLSAIHSILTDRYNNRRALVSSSDDAKFVKALADKELIVGAHAMWLLMRDEVRTSSSRPALAQRGHVAAALYRLGIFKNVESATESWRELAASIRKEHELLRASAGKITDYLDAELKEVAETHQSNCKTFDGDQAAREAAFAKLMDDHKRENEATKQLYKAELQLRSSVEYLTTKANDHKTAGKWFGFSAAAVGVATAGAAYWIVFRVFAESDTFASPKLAGAALIAALLFWLLRVLVRSYLSHMHLETDMRSRATFVQTYLALIGEGAAIKDEDRALIISLVFRPISDGLVKDDAAPPGLWEMVTRQRG